MNKIESIDRNDVQWSDLLDIHEVDPLKENDYACLEEVRKVLIKHGKQNRFGVTLVHKHFDVSEDEVMMEFTDVDSRIQTIKPVKKAELNGNSVETSWIFQDSQMQTMLACMTQCFRNGCGSHVSSHR